MRVAFYLNTPRAWTWPAFLEGELGLSGTDAQVLRTADQLARREGIEVLLIERAQTSAHPHIHSVQVESEIRAVDVARREKVSVLIFNNRGAALTRPLIEACERTGQMAVVWDHNGPNDEVADMIADAATVKRLVCVSNAQCDQLRHHRVFDKTEYIYNSVDPEFFAPGERERDSKRVVFVGYVGLTKGFHVLAAAWPAVRAAVPDASLHVLGSAELYEDRARLGPLGVAANEFEQRYIAPHLGDSREACAVLGVQFHGLVSPKRIRDELQVAAIGVVNPNSHTSTETFCVSAIEVQAHAVAVVGGRAGGLRETIRAGQTGLLVRNERELAAALIGLLQDPQRAAAMGRRGRRFVEEAFAPGRNTDRWLQLLHAATRGESPLPPRLRSASLNGRILVREALRRGARVPWVGERLPSIATLQRLLSSLRPRR